MSATDSATRLDAFLEEISFYVVCLIAAGLPLAFWALVYRSFSLPKALTAYVLILTLLVIAALRLWLVRRPPSLGLTGLLLIGFCLSLAPAAIGSINKATVLLGSYRQLAGLLSWLAMAAFAAAVSSITWEESRLKDLSVLVAIVTAILSLAAWAQNFWPEVNAAFYVEGGNRPVFAMFGNAGYLAAFLAFALPVIFVLSLQTKVKAALFAYVGTLALAVGALVFSGSRSGWAGAGAALLLGVFLWRRPSNSKRLAALAAFMLLVFVGALLATPAPPGGQEAPAQRLAAGPSTFEARVGYWRAAFLTVVAHPLTGSGPDTFNLVYPKLSTPASQKLEPETVTDDPHNIFLQVGANYGLPAFALFMILLLNAFLVSWPKNKTASASLLSGLTVGTAGYLLTVQTNVNSWGTAFIPWLFIGISASLARSDKTPKETEGSAWLAALLLIALIPALIFGLARLDRLRRADTLFVRAQTVSPSISIGYLRQSAELWPGDDFYWLNLAKALAAPEPRAAVVAVERAHLASPHSFLPFQFLAQFYLTDGRRLPDSRRLARDAAKRGLALFPNSPRLKSLYRSAVKASR